MIPVAKKTFGAVSKGIGFFVRQRHDWKVTVARTSSSTFLYQLVFPYLSIYIMTLGATATQLGIVNSIGMGIAGLLAPLTGWLIDRIGAKRIYLIGIGLLIISYLAYSVAQGLTVIIVAATAYWLGFAVSGHTCNVICANSLANEDRATGMSFCEIFAAGILGTAAPMLGAWLVTIFGGVNVSGIRPLFFVSLAGTIATFFLILSQLSNRRWGRRDETGTSFLGDLSQIFREGHNLKRWIIITSIGYLPFGMLLPFTQPFAHQVKGAEQYVLGAMVTGFALTPLLFGIPLGRLADRVGRKKVLYLTIPFVWASSLMIIGAPSPGFLIAGGILQGFIYIIATLDGAITAELVPPEQMGRWMGIIRLFRMLLAASSAFIAGVIWDNIGPQYVFLAVIGLDLFIKIPLLIGMPETRWRAEINREGQH